ncbi:amino acid/polyamine/organocation transporter, APC superfamily [Amycolatopsis marina]|uniref:Amino acid/polyamine/organocation transporter, APC superfamily n=1 Tax=Amycolatopsis marina TaxID=490629 RepID=A0A1I1BGP4_9PSEU|nr:APC family permease [Amycolatopsis marina]SFB49545.1 amino acid/polyamine/organocation transporter, APC superfamily [Amycolatopsis marina]
MSANTNSRDADPTVADPRAVAAGSTLSGNLGTGAIVFMVMAAAAPLTVIGGNVPLAIGIGNGAGAPVAFLIAAAVLLLFSIGFVAMTPHVREAGAFFSYVTEGIGKRAGMGIAFVALIAYTAIQVGIYGYLGWAVNDTVQFYGGPDVPWPVYAFAALVIVAVLGYRHIELSAKVLGVALICEVGIVVIMDALIFGSGGAEGINVESFTSSTITSGSIGVPILFALTGFIGFEATAVFRDEARDPARTIPRATYIAVAVIGSFYAITCWAMVLGFGVDDVVGVAEATLAGESNMLLGLADEYLGRVGRDVVNILLLTSLFACVLSFHNVIARYKYVLARKGLLPESIGRVHARHDSPSISSLVQTVTAALILCLFAVLDLDPLVGVFGSMAGVATMGMVLLMLSTSLAVIFFFTRRSDLREGHLWSTRVTPVLACLGLLLSLYLVVSNFTLVTGGSAGVSTFLGLIPVVGFIIGYVRGQGAHVARKP